MANKDKITNTNIQNTTQKTTDRSIRAPEREAFNVPLVTTVVLLLWTDGFVIIFEMFFDDIHVFDLTIRCTKLNL